jgi:hypothetical protein
MLIRSDKCGVQGGLAGFCFLSAPEGRLGGLRLGTQGLREITRPLQRSEKQRTTQKEFSQ